MRLALRSAWYEFNDALRLDTESAFEQDFAEFGRAGRERLKVAVISITLQTWL